MKLTMNRWLLRSGGGMKLKLGLGLWLAGLAMGSLAHAQAPTTTTVQGTVYLANGQPSSGTLFVSWPAFTTASGQAVAADSTTVTIAPDGFMSVNLVPNLGSTPAGLYYTAVYYLSDGTTSTQYWVVPAAAEASLAQVQAQLMPAVQAVQAVDKAYVDEAIAAAGLSQLTASGGTLTGPLYLSGDPTQPLQAADKHYVDTVFSEAVPLSGGSMTGALITPSVNGVESPVAGSSQPTLETAMTAAGTTGAVEIPPTYAGSDGFTNPNGVYVNDLRASHAQQIERSVKEFGAVCDGTTDDTNALHAALNYALAHGVALTIPQGTCKTRSLYWVGQSIGGLGKQVSALMGFPGEDVLASGTDAVNMQSYTRIHDLTIYVDQSLDISCSPAAGRAPAGSCAAGRLIERNSIFSPGGSGLTGTVGTGAGWSVGNCAIAMPAALGTGGNGLRTAVIENLEIAATGVDPMAAQYPGAHSTHTCGIYLAQWPQWSEFRNIDIRGLNTGIAIPALPVATPAGLNSDSNRWQNITIQATHGFAAATGSNNVLDNVVAEVGNSAATAEPPTGLVLDLSGTQQGWTIRNTVVLPAWNAVQPQLTVAAAGGAVTAVTVGTEHGLGFDPYGAQVPLIFSGSCTATGNASVNSNGSIGTVAVTSGGVGCSGTTAASLNASGAWDTAAPVNLIAGQNMRFFDGNLLKGNGGYTVWNAAASGSYGTQLGGGGGTLPGGGSYQALVANNPIGSAYQVDQFPGADFGAKLQACLSAVSASYGGTCDARNFTGTLSMGSNLTVSKANVTVQLPCATISTASQMIVTVGTRNVALRGCALRGASNASGSQGGTVFMYSGTGSMIQVGDSTYAADTGGFHLDNVVINTTTSSAATTQGLVAYRTQEMDLESLYFLGNQNQTGMTLDGTGNYTGGTFFDNAFNGFGTAVNAIGHQISNAATTDWVNASTFVRLHIDCPESGGSPIAGTYGINLQQGDGNTITGGDVEGCSTALHLGVNAQNNTIVGLRNEVSTNQVVADAGSAYNSWMTGGTMFTGALTDNGTRNSFLDTFHRSFNGLNGDWYGSQKDATVTNHYRLGIALGNERGLLNRYQTDYGYRWTTGLSDATAGAQFYEILDELNSVYRLSIGQYNNGQSSTNNQTVLNAAGTGAVVLNGSNNSGTGGVVIGSGGPSVAAVATISSAGNAQFNGTLQVGGTSTFGGSTMVKNQADAEIDATLWAGLTTGQKESLTYKDWNGNSQWYMAKDASNNWMLNSATGGLDSFKAYQSTNSGDTYINASSSSGAVRVNYETGSGTSFDIYGGASSTLYASFTGANSIKFPGLAASSGTNCVQVDDSGFISNTGSACGSGSGSGGGSGTVDSGSSGQIAYYAANGTTVGGVNTVPLTAGGTGASTAAGALTNLGGQPALGYSPLNPANNLSDVSSASASLVHLGAQPISLTGSGAPSLTCSGSANSGGFYTSSALSLYQCSNVTGTYQWNAVGGGGSGSGVSSFAAPSGGWPAWLVPTVTNSSSTPSLAVASSLTLANVGAGTASTGTYEFKGTLTGATTNSVLNAAEFSGSDCGAKINSADTSLGSTGGEIDVNLACGTTWTPVVLSANHNLVFTQTGTYTAAGISLSGNNILDLRGAELQMPAYSAGPTAGMFTLYNGTAVASNVWIENGILDGNAANTPSAESCSNSVVCRPGVLIDNGGNSTAVHDIHIQNVTFQNWSSNPIALVGTQEQYPPTLHFPLPSNIYVDGDRFINNGGNNIYSAGWDRNLSITNNYFTGWGSGITTGHNSPITTVDFTNYSGTSQIGLAVTGNTFVASHSQPSYYNYDGELGAGGAGFITNFVWENNQMIDKGSSSGSCLSGIFLNGTITGNLSTRWGFCEITGSNIAITGNTIQNGTISLNPSSVYSAGNTIAGNTIEITGPWGPYSYVPSDYGITIGGDLLKTITLTGAIKQTAQTFNVAGDNLTFTPQTSIGSPPLVTITGSFPGGASNGFQNWAFSLSGAGNTTQGATNPGNNGTFICYSSTAATMSFVNPYGASETLPTNAQLSSSASTTAYPGTFFNFSTQNFYGGFNEWIGQPGISVAGFSNAGNNASALTVTATAYSASGGAVTIIAPNAFAAGQPVEVYASPTDALSPLNGVTYTVSSTGLSSSQFEISTGSVSGSGATAATIRGIGFTAIANSTTVLAVTNTHGVNETAAGTMSIAPAIANSIVSANDIIMDDPASTNCGAIFVGYSDDRQGTFYNLAIDNNVVSSGYDQCEGIYVTTNVTGTYPESLGLDLKDNVLSNTYYGVRADAETPALINDVTIEGNKITANSIYTAISWPTPPPGYRQWDNVVSSTQTAEDLNGGATVDGSGNISSPGWVSGGVFAPAQSGAVTWNSAVAVNVVTLAGNVTSSTIANGAFAGQQVCFSITQGSSVYSIVWPANMYGMSQPSQTAYSNTYQCAVYLAAGASWQALAPAIDGLGNTYLPGTMNAPTIVDRGLTSASLVGTNGSGTLVAASTTGTGNAVLAIGPTFTGNTTTFANGAAAEQDVVIQPGTGEDQVGALGFNNYAGISEWKLRKDASNYFKLTDVVNSLDRETFYPNNQTLINSGAGANSVLINSSTGSGTGGFYVESGGSSPAAVFSTTASGNTTATGFVSGKFMMGSGTMSLGAGAAGSGATFACVTNHVCDGVSGTAALTTGTSTTTGTLATLSFPNTHTNMANCVVTATLSGTGLVTSISWSESTTALTLTANAALTASTAYQVRYWCGGN